MVFQHLERHTQGIFSGSVPLAWLKQHRKFVCEGCQKIVSESYRNSHYSRCSVSPTAEGSHAGNEQLPSLDEVFSLNRPTLKHVPACAKQIWGRILQGALQQAIFQNNTESYTYLAMLPKCVLPSEKRGGKNNQHRQNVVSLCERWEAGDRLVLWSAAKENAKPKTGKQGTEDKRAAHQRREAAAAFAEDGLYGKACRVLTSKGLAPNTPETRALLEKKHPKHTPPTVPEFTVPPMQLPTDFNIREALRTFPNGTACGPTGLRVEHLLSACEATLPAAFQSTLRVFTNHLIAGKAPSETAPFYAGAALTALLKPALALDIRPIAVGEILRRLAGKCICKLSGVKAEQLLAPHQFGVACPGGWNGWFTRCAPLSQITGTTRTLSF
jgi:hypothetical protein